MILLFFTSLQTQQFGQQREEENKEYVYTQLHAVLGEFPKLAWALPDGMVAAESLYPQIAVYSGSPTVEVAKLQQKLSPAETLKFADTNRIACDAHLAQNPQAFSLYSSATKTREHNPQVLFTSKAPVGMSVGFRRGPLDDQLGAEVWKRMKPESPKQLRKSFVIGQEGTSYLYSFAALYYGPNQEVSRYGVFLHSDGGQIVASQITDPNGEWCDGCAVPTFRDGIDQVFLVVNLFALRGFKYPVLILDTSTVEGRSLTIATFSPEGKYSSHLFYEYTVGCSQ